ncbi:hypothetical protein RCF34_02810 [Pseudomonas sp. 102515]|uniref:hypothetical protein n=1 Tax=Pseudomonas sp. 102515 TaxID=3071568 RepID=UPI00280202BF|nr:hypothetical protein [Pseudomonas sp. 102515]MDQ7912041.1 hypothetical protein [Pseudomonas sp. 102515]
MTPGDHSLNAVFGQRVTEVKHVLKSIGAIAMLVGLAAVLLGWLIDPSLSLQCGIKFAWIKREFLQTDLLLWGALLFAPGFNGYALHTDL